MKKITILKFFFLFFLVTSTCYSQNVVTLPFHETFNYTAGTKLFADGASQGLGDWWTDSPRTGTKQEIVAQPSWVLTSNVVEATNNALSTSTFGEDPEINFTPQSGNFGEVFASMFVEIDASLSSNLTGVDLDRIFQLGSAASVIARGVTDGGGNVIGVQFGVNEDSGPANAADVVWDPTTYNEGQQLFMVFSYTRNSSSDTAAKLWINPVVDGTEPAVTVEDTTIRLTTVDYLRLNIAGSNKTPELIVDEIRIGNSWNDVAPVQESLGNGSVEALITTSTTPTFPVYESFDNYATGTVLIPDSSQSGIGAWATKDEQTGHDFAVIDSPIWGSTGTATGVNNSGKAVQFETSKEDAYLQFTEQTGNFGTIYASFLMRVTDISNINTTPGRLVGFGTLNSGGTVSGASHLYISKDADNSSAFNIGVNEDNGYSDTPEFVGGAVSPTEFTENQDLFVVLYFDDTNTTSTTAKIWVNPTVGGAEPAPDATDGPRNLNASFLIFSQLNTSLTPEVIFDEIRIASTWDEATNVKHTWTGASADWGTTSNWDNSIVPTALSNVVIPSGATNEPVIGATTGAIAHNLTVDAAADLSIASGGSLQLTGKADGDITYNLSIPDTDWHLVASPVIGQEYDDTWVSANGIASGSTTATNRGIATYDNTTDDPTTSYWRYMQAGETKTFERQGYSLKRTSSGTYSFTGTYPRVNFEIPITQSSGNNWNLVNNPYPSYLSVADFVTANTSNLGAAFQGVYVWNAGNGVYDLLTSGHIHPGQAFFVSSNVADGTIDITESLQSSQTGVTFYKNSSNPNIELILSSNDLRVSTKFNLLENATNGLNPGQDFGLFTGVRSNFSIYSHLVEDNTGIPLEIQSLNVSNLDDLEIPIGVNALKGSEIKFMANNFDLPKGVDLILEDRVANTFTNLKTENSEYTVQLAEDLSGTGRFYLLTKSSALNTVNVGLDDVSIYMSGSSTLNISGLSEENFNLKIFNILGERVMNKNLKAISGKSQANLGNLNTGIYIVKIETEEGNTNKKIILE